MKAPTRVVFALLLMACFATPASVAAAKSLNGKITGEVQYPNGKPASGVTVQLWRHRVIGLPPMDWQSVKKTTTNRVGKYSLSAAPGTYRVWFVPKDLNRYCMEAYPDEPTHYHGDDVVVRVRRTTSDISVQLDGSPSSIEGTVTDISTEPVKPMSGMRMGLCLQGYALVNTIYSVTANSQGFYRIGGLKPYDWGVAANSADSTNAFVFPDYDMIFGGLYDWSIDREGMTEQMDFNCQPRGFVNVVGRLVYSGTHQPVVGARVQVQALEPDNGHWYGDDSTTVETDSNGMFRCPDAVPGYPPNNLGIANIVLFAFGGPFEDEFYDNANEAWGAQQVEVRRGKTVDVGTWEVDPS